MKWFSIISWGNHNFLDLLSDALISVKCDNKILQEIKLSNDSYFEFMNFLKLEFKKDYEGVEIIYRGFKFLIKKETDE